MYFFILDTTQLFNYLLIVKWTNAPRGQCSCYNRTSISPNIYSVEMHVHFDGGAKFVVVWKTISFTEMMSNTMNFVVIVYQT